MKLNRDSDMSLTPHTAATQTGATQTGATLRTFRPATPPPTSGRVQPPSADTAFLRDLRAISVDRIVTPNQIVISEKAGDQMVGFVLSGVLRTVKTFADGTEKAVKFIHPGGFFGRLFMPSGFTVEAARLSRLRCANRAEFERLLAAHPDIQQRFFEKALSDLDLTRTWFPDNGFGGAVAGIAPPRAGPGIGFDRRLAVFPPRRINPRMARPPAP